MEDKEKYFTKIKIKKLYILLGLEIIISNLRG